jgi:hypothetical protein
VWVIAGKGHLGLEVATVVERVWVEHNQGHAPLKDIVVQELYSSQSVSQSVTGKPIGGRHTVVDMAVLVGHTSMLVQVSLLSALNSFMSTRCAASAMVSSLALSERPVLWCVVGAKEVEGGYKQAGVG